MVTLVQLPGNIEIEFPDGMVANDITSVIGRYAPQLGMPSTYRSEPRRDKLSREMTHTQAESPGPQAVLDSLALGSSPIPLVGDVMGLAADAHMFANEPESRTPLNFGLSGLGLLPFVPGVAGVVSRGADDITSSVAKALKGRDPDIRHLQMPEHTSLTSALDDEGQLIMTHYSDQKLGSVDPEMYGKNLSGRTIAEANRAADPDFAKRSSFMLETADDRYIRERGIQPVKNKVRVPPEQLYDPRKDPLGLWGKAKTPDEVTQAEKRIKQAGFSGYFVNHPTMGNVAQVFDELPVESPLSLRYSHGELSQIPDVPQFPLKRYVAPRGMPKGTEELMTPEVMDRLVQYSEAGKDAGGKAWYNLTPLREAFTDVLGPEEGVKQFNDLADIIAATSPRSTVYKNIVRAGFLRNQKMRGKPLDSFANLDKATGKPKGGRANVLPPGKGHLAHETHQHLLTELEKGGHFESANRPKTSSFAENLKGNLEPITIDTHNMSALKGDPNFKKSPTKAQYKFLEDFEAGVAKDLGIANAQLQSTTWMGAGTGVADERPFMDVFRDVVKHTAKKLDTSFEAVVEGFIKGDIDLQQLLIPVTAGVIGGAILGQADETE